MRGVLFAALLTFPTVGIYAQSESGETPATAQVWTAWGGDLGFIWNEDLLADLGARLDGADGTSPQDARGFIPVSLRETGGLTFAVTSTNFDHFTGGSLGLRGGFRLRVPDGELSLVDASLSPRAGDPQTLDLVSADGKTWFYLDKLMYSIGQKGRVLDVQTMDLRIHPALAERLGKPQVANWAIAQLRMTLDVLARNGEYIEIVEGGPVWPNTEVPGVPGAFYQGDVFMTNFNAQYSRCTNAMACTSGCTCDGPGGATNGFAVFTPSSTLRNNVNNGTAAATVAGDPLGTSTALYTADIAWYRKFTGSFPPYDNDQHPNLIWNLYRIDGNGRIEQIGRSGVKHAFVTTNGGCSSGPGSGGSTGTILGRSCSDTYGTSNNDSNPDLGPRSEIVPNGDLWGRCGSIFDTNCDRSAEASNGNTNYSQRMIVRESQLEATTPASTYLFESWYIVRDDINVYNTMATRPVSFSYAGGGPWVITNSNPYLLGPAIDRWVSPTSSNPNQKNVEIANEEGHTKVAVKATDLGDGTWRYDYVVMNVDFARAFTQGTNKYGDDADPAQRFRVVHNFGFDRFSVPVPADAAPTAIEFNDGDLDTANNWTGAVANGVLTWTAPANPSPPANVPAVLNALNWGTMFRFSFVSTRPPVAADIALHVAQTGKPESYSATIVGPQVQPDGIFEDDFEVPADN
ncbi:MAG TPA: hypothetical protein VM555_05115 [Tahibacter sp.]|nr:hypothetical protein [Tahibacter sp.]